jgi:peptidoglycan/LPS O-acetylase OafA/YrhL
MLGAIVYGLSEPASMRIGVSMVLSIFFVPTPFSMPPIISEQGSLYPFDGPAWSLFFELAVNALWFSLKPRLTNRRLIVMCAFGAVLLVASIIYYGSIGGGSNWATFLGGFCRAIYSFFAGIAVYRFWRSTSVRIRAPIWLIAVALLAIFAAPLPRAPFDMLCTLILFPAIVLAGAMCEPLKWLASTCIQMGALSYAVYVLHVPLYAMALFAVEKRHLFASPTWTIVTAHPSILTTPITVASVIALAWLLDRYYDIPVRRWLSR